MTESATDHVTELVEVAEVVGEPPSLIEVVMSGVLGNTWVWTDVDPEVAQECFKLLGEPDSDNTVVTGSVVEVSTAVEKPVDTGASTT